MGDTKDPMEKIILDALRREGFAFTDERSNVNMGLDYHLTDYGIHIEVKQFHSDRIAGQMARGKNVIAVQGREAVEFFAALLVDFMTTKTATLSELKRMKERGEIQPPRPDAPEIDMADGFWERAEEQYPKEGE